AAAAAVRVGAVARLEREGGRVGGVADCAVVAELVGRERLAVEEGGRPVAAAAPGEGDGDGRAGGAGGDADGGGFGLEVVDDGRPGAGHRGLLAGERAPAAVEDLELVPVVARRVGRDRVAGAGHGADRL